MEIRNYCPECKNLIGATKMAERYRDDAEKLQQEVDDLMRLWRADGDIIKAYRETCQKFEAERDEARADAEHWRREAELRQSLLENERQLCAIHEEKRNAASTEAKRLDCELRAARDEVDALNATLETLLP